MSTALRREVRELVARTGIEPYAHVDAWMRGHDVDFTAAMAEAGLIGISWPSAVGGRGGSAVDRLVLAEELLRVGAPVAAHWISDRQIGPAILRHGTEGLQREFLPGIASGQVSFCLGMSEPGSGSDLAAVRTRATKVEDGWTISGTKIWTSHAHRSSHAYVLARTASSGAKHEGLSEFIVDLSAPGVQIRPIIDLAGEHHFNEMVFDDVFVPDRHLLGTEGDAWRQVTEQLAFERGGMERVLSTYPLLARAIDNDAALDVSLSELGSLVARLHTLRAMAVGIAEAMDAGQAPVQQAALLKYLGTAFEGDVVEFFRDAVGRPPLVGRGTAGLLAAGITSVPGTTVRGGATEVLLTIVGRETLSPRLSANHQYTLGDPDIGDVVEEVLRSSSATDYSDADSVWRSAVELGWTTIGVPEAAGGSGGTLADLAGVAQAIARAGQSAPVTDTALSAWLLASAGIYHDAAEVAVIVDGNDLTVTKSASGWLIDGQAMDVPWASRAARLLVLTELDDEPVALLVDAPADGLSVTIGHNIAGEPRDTVNFSSVQVPDTALLAGGAVDLARNAQLALNVAATLGAIEAALGDAVAHVNVREQFGKPLAAFQAVTHAVARMAAELSAARVAVYEAVTEVESDGVGWRVLAARIVVAHAATVTARAAHQLLGAMGITHEHRLHRATLRLWSWRDELVSEREAARRLGAAALAAGAEETWDWLVRERAQLSAMRAWDEVSR